MTTCAADGRRMSVVSAVIPVRNGAAYLEACLTALRASSPLEIIVVDDGSTDDSGTIARSFGAIVEELHSQRGAAAARNRGAARAVGDVLLFVDSDVTVRPDTVERVADLLCNDGELAAVFGSYDDSPGAPNTVSQFKNLVHHFVHQRGDSDAATFWTGCGAVRREVFFAVGGFDETRHAMEDVEFGYRMRRYGLRIRLEKHLQVKHLKRWTIASLIRSDIFDRAIPWSRLIIERGRLGTELNLGIADRLSAACVALAAVSLPLAFVSRFRFAPPVLLAPAIVVNHRLYRFFLARRGLAFTLQAIPIHLLYYLYSGIAYALCWALMPRRERP